MSLSTLKMFTNGMDYIIAESLEQARNILCRGMHGLDQSYEDLEPILQKELDGYGWKLKDNEETFTLYLETGGGITRTVEDWIGREGEGFFASSEY